MDATVDDAGGRCEGDVRLLRLLDRELRGTRIRFLLPDGPSEVGGAGSIDFVVRVTDAKVFDRMVAFSSLGLGEAWMDGSFQIVEGRLCDLIVVLLRAGIPQRLARDPRLLATAALTRARHAVRGETSNVRAHYDVGDDLFESFLDGSMAYSCGYARTGEDTLEDLQRNKFDRICQKLALQPGMRVVDIGCGFGGLLMHAAREYGAECIGITNSARHHARGSARIAEAGLHERVSLRQGTFEELEGSFDRVVSVGMLEHVPRSAYRAYFDTIGRLVAPGGRALVHTIGCSAVRNDHDPFIQKYIFPGSNQPRLSEMAREVERIGMYIVDVENLVRHYAVTCERWLERFMANAHRLDPSRYDERFRRMWEFYLHLGIVAARATESTVYQLLFSRENWVDLPYARV